MARRLERHGACRSALGVLTGCNQHPHSVGSGDPGLVTGRSAGVYTCVTRHRIDHDVLGVQDVLALAHYDISSQRNCLRLHIIDAQITAGVLILGDHGHAAACFRSTDISALRHSRGGLTLGGPRSWRNSCVGTALRSVKHNKASALHDRVALRHLDVTGERGRLDLVQNFQRFRLNMDRLLCFLGRLLVLILCGSDAGR